MADIDLTEAVEATARVLAMLKPGEAWPTNAELGGNLTGTRDDEFYRAMRDEAAEAIETALPFVVAQVRAQIAAELDALVVKWLAVDHAIGSDAWLSAAAFSDAARIARGDA